MGRVYATSSDYATYTGATAPSGIDRSLAAASLLVETEMLRTAVYDTDDDGLPTDTDVIEAMRDATCAQAEYSRAQGDANLVGAGQVSAFSIGGLSVTKGASSVQSRSPWPSTWSPVAIRILDAAGLLGTAPGAY